MADAYTPTNGSSPDTDSPHPAECPPDAAKEIATGIPRNIETEDRPVIRAHTPSTTECDEPLQADHVSVPPPLDSSSSTSEAAHHRQPARQDLRRPSAFLTDASASDGRIPQHHHHRDAAASPPVASSCINDDRTPPRVSFGGTRAVSPPTPSANHRSPAQAGGRPPRMSSTNNAPVHHHRQHSRTHSRSNSAHPSPALGVDGGASNSAVFAATYAAAHSGPSGGLDWAAAALDEDGDAAAAAQQHAGYPSNAYDHTGGGGYGDSNDADYDPQERRVADEIALQIGMQVSLVYFAFATMALGTLAVLQGILVIVKVDGEKDDMSWDGVLVPMWILLALIVAVLAAYFIGGFADQHVRFAARHYDEYKMEMVAAADGDEAQEGRGGAADAENGSGEAAEDLETPGGRSSVTPTTPFTPNRRGHVMRMSKRVRPPAANGTASNQCGDCPAAAPAGASCGGSAAAVRAMSDEELARMWAVEHEHFRSFLKALHAAMLAIVPAYVLAASLAGRLAAHPRDYSPWVPFSFAFIAEAVVFAIRLHTFGRRDRRIAVIRRIETAPSLCHVGAAIYSAFVLAAPVMRVTALAMITVQVKAVIHLNDGTAESATELPLRWIVAFSPCLGILAGGLIVHTMIVRTRHSSNNDPDRNPCATGVIAGAMLALAAVSAIATVLRLDGTIAWPLAACLAPAMLVFLCIACIGTTIGCFVASAKVELPAEADQVTTDAVIRTF